MRFLNVTGTALVILGAYVFSAGASGSFRYALPGSVIAGAGVVMLALAVAIGGLPEVSDDESGRSRRRSIPERSDRMNEEPVAE
jgi:putative effector of murein hydrolase LrgA (UPF0299 family)